MPAVRPPKPRLRAPPPKRSVRMVAWTIALVVGVLLLWRSPFSPLAVARGDVLYGQGNHEAAVTHWMRVGQWHPLAGARTRANLRAATVASVDLGDTGAAVQALHVLLADAGAPSSVKADAWERLGHLEWTRQGDPEAAAGAFELAWRLDPSAPKASERLVAAARARADDGDVKAAVQAWDRVARRVPARRALACIAQGALHLSTGDVHRALTAYEDAIVATHDPALLQAARLGAATCRERLGDIDAALADLDAADLPEDVAIERARRLEARRPD